MKLPSIPARMVLPLQGALLVTLAVLALLARLEAREAQSIFVPPQGSVYHLPDVRFARLGTLGYHEAAADLAWLRTIIYFGEQATVRGRFERFGSYVDLVIALDPGFRRIYHWAGVLSIYSKTRITRDMVESSIHYLELGAKRFPGDGEMEYTLGFNLYFEYPVFLKGDAAASRKAKLDAIEHLKAAVVAGTGPPWLASMVASLMQKQGLEEMAIQHLERSLAYVDDEQTRAKILARIREIDAESHGAGQMAFWERFEKEWAGSYPYLDLDMYLLVRPRPLFPPEASVRPVLAGEQALDVLDALDVDR